MKRIKIGSIVVCRLYNTPDGKFYGETFAAEVVEKKLRKQPGFNSPIETNWIVKRSDNSLIELKRKEIKSILR